MSLKGKTILITGATSGIGRAIAEGVVAQSGIPILWGRSEERLSATALDLGLTLKHTCVVDLTDEESVRQGISKIHNLDGLVLSAGVLKILPLKMYKSKYYDDIFSLNVKANFFLLGQLLRQKKFNKPASIVSISSVSSKHCFLGSSLYSASKAALNALIKNVAIEAGIDNIRANSVLCGIISNTQMSSQVSPEYVNNLKENSLLGPGSVSSVADVVRFLLSDESRWITGSEICVDGGYSIYRGL